MRTLIASVALLLIGSLPLWAQPYGTGMKLDDDQYQNVPRKAALTRGMYVEKMPRKASLKEFCPTPGSQGQLGTCVGWSSNYAAMTIVEAKRNQWRDKATTTRNTYSPGFIYHMIKDKNDKECTFGTSIYDALNYMKYNGTVKKSDFDVQCVEQVSPQVIERASQNKIKDFARLFDREQSGTFKVQATKKSLAEGNPVVYGMIMPPSFYDAKGVWKPTEQPSGNYGGHAMCVVGYDDDQYGGAFEIINSWGTEWGNDGFMWVTYDDFGKFAKYAYEIISDPLPKPPAVPDMAGSVKLMTDRGKPMDAMFQNGIYKMVKPWKSGTSFRIYISNNEPAYVYAIGTDNTGEIFQLFPYDPLVSPALTYSQNDVALPSEEHYITMDNTVGKDYLCVLYCKDPIDIEGVKEEIQQASGANFYQKLQAVLGDFLVGNADVNFTPNAMKFSGFSKGKNTVALIVEIEHI